MSRRRRVAILDEMCIHPDARWEAQSAELFFGSPSRLRHRKPATNCSATGWTSSVFWSKALLCQSPSEARPSSVRASITAWKKKRPASHIAGARARVAGNNWELEFKRTRSRPRDTGSHTIPAEYVPEAGPTHATAPVRPRLSVTQFARDLRVDPAVAHQLTSSFRWLRVPRTRVESVR